MPKKSPTRRPPQFRLRLFTNGVWRRGRRLGRERGRRQGQGRAHNGPGAGRKGKRLKEGDCGLEEEAFSFRACPLLWRQWQRSLGLEGSDRSVVRISECRDCLTNSCYDCYVLLQIYSEVKAGEDGERRQKQEESFYLRYRVQETRSRRETESSGKFCGNSSG